MLEGHLRSLAAARVERGTEVVASRTAHDGVTLTVRDIEGGSERRIHTRYLIAADGVRSTVRSALGIAASRRQELEARLSVLFRAPLWELVGDRRYAIYFITGAASPRVRAVGPPGSLGVRDGVGFRPRGRSRA